MPEREIPNVGYDSETRNKILNTATKYFALRGVVSVSMRDIARAVGIKMSSIYYYYESKEALLEDVLLRFEESYRLYFEWQSAVNEKANSVEELLDNMFNQEFLEMRNPLTCFGMSLIVKEQHNNETARQLMFELFYQYSIERMQADFERLAEKGIIPSIDAKMIATLFMFSVLAGNDISIHEYMGAKPSFDRVEMYQGLKAFITSTLKQGV